MSGREDKNANNLFFLCSLIEYISRKTKNHRSGDFLKNRKAAPTLSQAQNTSLPLPLESNSPNKH